MFVFVNATVPFVRPAAVVTHANEVSPFFAQASRDTEEMKKDKSSVSTNDKKKDLVSKLSRLSIDDNVFEGSTELPQVFQVCIRTHARACTLAHTRTPVHPYIDRSLSLFRCLPFTCFTRPVLVDARQNETRDLRYNGFGMFLISRPNALHFLRPLSSRGGAPLEKKKMVLVPFRKPARCRVPVYATSPRSRYRFNYYLSGVARGRLKGTPFQVKYLGSHDARGLWGIKHTRWPVDNMVAAAKALPTKTMLPLVKLVVSQEGVALLPLEKRKQNQHFAKMYAIETISYGVQDLIYTRVFSMIVVRETENFRRVSPFECHGFVCESKYHAVQLTYALSTAFDIYSRTVKAQDKMAEVAGNKAKKRFAIDLRSPEELEAELAADSEA